MSEPLPCIRIVDDEPATREALDRLLRAAGMRTRTYASATAFLESDDPSCPGCLLLDVNMPGMDGLELQQSLARGRGLPIVFLTCHGTIPVSVRAMKAGAVDFLTKPVEKADLLRAIRSAVERNREEREERRDREAWLRRFERLTPREREVMQRVVRGQLNKQIAADLGTSEQNIKFHRGHVMDKMGVESLAELVRAAGRLGVE